MDARLVDIFLLLPSLSSRKSLTSDMTVTSGSGIIGNSSSQSISTSSTSRSLRFVYDEITNRVKHLVPCGP